MSNNFRKQKEEIMSNNWKETLQCVDIGVGSISVEKTSSAYIKKGWLRIRYEWSYTASECESFYLAWHPSTNNLAMNIDCKTLSRKYPLEYVEFKECLELNKCIFEAKINELNG